MALFLLRVAAVVVIWLNPDDSAFGVPPNVWLVASGAMAWLLIEDVIKWLRRSAM